MLFDDNFRFRVTYVLVLLAPIFLLTVRGWTNTLVGLLALWSFANIVLSPKKYFSNRPNAFWFISLCFSLPFLTEITVQILRYFTYSEIFHGGSIDTVFRGLVGGIIFIYLSKNFRLQICQGLTWGCATSVIVTFIYVNFLQQGNWESSERGSVYFVDPNSFGVYAVALGSLAFLIELRTKNFSVAWLLRALLLLASLELAVLSESRSALLASLCLIFYLIYYKLKSKVSLPLLLLMWITLSAIIILFLGYFKIWRVHEILPDLSYYFSTINPKETSVGSRVELLRTQFELFKLRPILGFADGSHPDFDTLRLKFPISHDTFNIQRFTGSHVEFLAWTQKQGLLGLLSVFAIFLIPLRVFYLRVKSDGEKVSAIAISSLAFVTVVSFGGIGIQVLNLKMFATFYAFVVACSVAYVFNQDMIVKRS